MENFNYIFVVLFVLIIFLIIGWKNFSQYKVEKKLVEIKDKLDNNITDSLITENILMVKDKPIDFGYKTNWLAIKSLNQDEVIKALKPKSIITSNWENSINKTFVSPSINEWILVVNYYPVPDHLSTIEKSKQNLINLSKELGEVQLFGSHRGVDFSCWLKAVDGKIIRAYSHCEGETLINEGELSSVEENKNLVNTLSEKSLNSDYFDTKDLVYPDEDLVIEIAESWSVNPLGISKINNVVGSCIIVQGI